ncbi:endoribonuclease YbeY isoform X1 [Diceros bicornis minor]|uniref:endoribonuclease YbeY isoform X1 n=1 Tax=Diceros bicornis minor TaxID=77932 RepID=UPI0026ECDAAC|nr:endoribonuclease YbeY isoform X1 [Diceros bicornis minor]XP_058379303.1 endoribonuclease YbeY isoform X1 [Diceros bicornis minor]
MSLVLRNLQRAVPLRRAPLRKKMEIVRNILGVQKFDLGIICVDNKNIQHINRVYRERNIPTDVLSFPFHENLKAGEIPQPDFPDDYNLGDIFLGVEYIFQQCKENEDYYDILTVTATHGLCHLLGFTHSTEAEWQKTRRAFDDVTSSRPVFQGLSPPGASLPTRPIPPGGSVLTHPPLCVLGLADRRPILLSRPIWLVLQPQARSPLSYLRPPPQPLPSAPPAGSVLHPEWRVGPPPCAGAGDDVPEGEAGSRGAELADRYQAPAPEQGPLLRIEAQDGTLVSQGAPEHRDTVAGRQTPPFGL